MAQDLDVRIISIGALAAHPLWNERAPVRTGHATTTLIRGGRRAIVVDPGLPAPVLAARLSERANIAARDVTDVFLTIFHPDMMRGLRAFDGAQWWISERERETVGPLLLAKLRDAADEGEADLRDALAQDAAILERCKAAPDSLMEQVDLFPLPGVTPGSCGLLIGEARRTTLVCGDAVATVEHIEQGKVLPRCADVEQARESFAEAIEIADVLIPGRDNVVFSPSKRPF